MKSITITLAVVFLIVGPASAKPSPINKISVCKSEAKTLADVFGSFHVHRQHLEAALNWDVLTDNVSSFIIERSYDGEFFSSVAEVNPSATRWNRFNDNTVEPGLIYYRIIAVMNDGTLEYSPTELVKIVRHK